jgi:hypothetical protein
MKKNAIYRHGDMIIYKVSDLDGSRKSKNKSKLVVGLGEVTGHSHDIIALEGSEVFGVYDGEIDITENDLAEMDRLFFEVTGNGAVITHEEHKPIYLEAGKYLRINQVEFNPFTQELEKVRD